MNKLDKSINYQGVIKVFEYQRLWECTVYQRDIKVIDYQGKRGKFHTTNLFCNALIINKLDLLQLHVFTQKVSHMEAKKLGQIWTKKSS